MAREVPSETYNEFIMAVVDSAGSVEKIHQVKEKLTDEESEREKAKQMFINILIKNN